VFGKLGNVFEEIQKHNACGNYNYTLAFFLSAMIPGISCSAISISRRP